MNPGPSSAGPTEEDLRRHQRACASGEQAYTDTAGRFVLTSHRLREAGGCCGQGCRHCPWPPSEQRRAGRPERAPAWPWPTP